MKTLYEILEVSENASQEIIEKAYKVLAKKYHPDLQPQEKKQEAEKTMKMLNEAYCVLSNPIKRKSYDEKLQEQRKQEMNYYHENIPNAKEQQYQTAGENQNNKIKYKWTWKNDKDFIITIFIIIAIGAFLWFLPPTHKVIVEFYESNPIIKTIADVIGNIFLGIWNAICSIFK